MPPFFSKTCISSCLAVLFCVASLSEATAQNIYHVHWRDELIATGLGLAAVGTGFALGQRIQPFSSVELTMLDPQRINRWDRPATRWYSEQADLASDVLSLTTAVAPTLFLADPQARKEALTIAVLYVETVSVVGGLTHLIKNIAARTRPYAYNPLAPLKQKQKRDARRSFFSGHTSSTASACFFTAKVWSDFHPNSPWKPVVWTAAIITPAVTGYLRLRAGRHFLSDVAVGYAVGGAVGWLVPALHRNRHHTDSTLRFYQTPDGAGLVWNW